VAITSSWRRIRVRVVEKGNPDESFPPLNGALSGVMGSASQRTEHTRAQGFLDEEKASNDDDEPDD